MQPARRRASRSRAQRKQRSGHVFHNPKQTLTPHVSLQTLTLIMAGSRRRRDPPAHLHGDLAAVGHADADVDSVQAAARGLLLHEVQPERLGHVCDLRRTRAQFRVRAGSASGARGCRSRRRGEARTARVRAPTAAAWWTLPGACGLARALSRWAGLWRRAGTRACRWRASRRSRGVTRRPDRLPRVRLPHGLASAPAPQRRTEACRLDLGIIGL